MVGQWIYGNAEETSIFIIEHFFNLTYEEKLAIKYHHGAFHADSAEDKAIMSNAFKLSEFAFMLHLAEDMTTFIDENTNDVSYRRSSETFSKKQFFFKLGKAKDFL